MALSIDREKVLLAAQGFIQRKRYDKAVAEYQKIIQQDPDDARTLLKIGDLQSKMESHADAIATYERVGKHYAEQGFALKAIAVYKQIREIIQKHVPELTDEYSHITPQLAELYAQLGLVSDALAAYDEVATQLQRAGHDARAVEIFKKIVDLDNINPLPHLRLAEAYSRIKNVDDAIGHFGTAAEILIKLGRQDDALKVLERLLHHRSDPNFARRAAEIYLARGRVNDGMLALAKLQTCFQADPRNLDTLSLLARAFVGIGQPAKSIEVQKELARIAKDQGNFNVWRETVDRLVEAAPNDEQVQRLLTSPPARQTATAAPPSGGVIALDDSDIEELSADDIELEKSEAPAPMRWASSRLPAISSPELEVSEAAIDAEEMYGEYAGLDPMLHPRRIMADGDSFHKLGLYDKAIARLEEGVVAHPRSVPLRRKLRDILYEQGDFQPTADQMIIIGQVLLENGEAEAGAEELAAILGFAPDHPIARQMLLDLGYEIPTAQYPTLGSPDEVYGEPYRDPIPTVENLAETMARADMDSAPLPSYDLEDVDPARAMSSPGYDVSAGTYEAKRDAMFERGALPSFPMDDQEDEGTGQLARPIADMLPPPAGGNDAIEDALEEAEFFLSRGLLEDAHTILDEQLRRFPNHPLLLERQRELDLTIAQTTGSSGTRERPLRQQSLGHAENQPFDIAASLDALDALDSLDRADAPSSGFGHPSDTIDVEEVFAKFKAGVRAQVSETDSATHYDLGLAYREMDLIQDAIDEFELAARDPKRECVCQSMIGMIHRSQNNVNAAIDAFIKGLHAEHKTSEQEVSLYYELGDAYESKGNASEALYYFRKVAHRSPGYDDPRGSVAMRVRGLQSPGQRPARERAVGASDEFDAAFDAALGSKH
ncbi:MAG TPA: tetratricopeptide repeat protein [Polyangiaceae bacterium]